MKFFFKTMLRLFTALMLALFVFFLAGQASMALTGQTSPAEQADSDQWLSTILFQGFILMFSVILMLLLGKGKLSPFGFTAGTGIPYLRIALIVLALEFFTSLAMVFLPVEGPGHFADTFTFPQIVVGIWLLASTSEEVFTRGLIQSFLNPLKRLGFSIKSIFISAPVLFSALLFMAIHIPLLIMGMDVLLGVQILFSTFVLGMIAGYYREKTGSLIPAVLAHMSANIFGMGFGYLFSEVI